MTHPAPFPRVILGRKACPWCGFHAAHVRQRSGAFPYLYCPECGLHTSAKNGHQAGLLTKGMRPEGGAGAVPTVPSSPADILVPREGSRVASWLDQLLRAADEQHRHPRRHRRERARA